MKGRILKASIITLILIVFLMFAASSVSADANNAEDNPIQTLSKGGLVINYPSDWGYSKANSQYSIMSISKLDSIDAGGVGQVNINFEKKPIEGDFYNFISNNYKAMEKDPSFQIVSSGQSSIAGKEAVEYIYISKELNLEREHKAVWFEKGGQAYVLLYSAPVDQFDSNMYVFDYILSDIQIT